MQLIQGLVILLKLSILFRRGDSKLKNHHINHKENAFCLTKTTQNELFKFCGELFSEVIVSEIKSVTFFFAFG